MCFRGCGGAGRGRAHAGTRVKECGECAGRAASAGEGGAGGNEADKELCGRAGGHLGTPQALPGGVPASPGGDTPRVAPFAVPGGLWVCGCVRTGAFAQVPSVASPSHSGFSASISSWGSPLR